MALSVSGSTIFSFSPRNQPALRVASGATVEVQTLDCFANQLRKPEDTLDAIDWERVNPATGPIYVKGARPGDTLKVTIERIQVDSQGVMATGKDFGTFGGQFDRIYSRIFPIREGKAVFDEELLIPLRPMVGVIGVAPADRDVNCGTPGSHGGNMDNTMIAEGSTLYLPVFVDGALFALGDLHAVMGDGEVAVTGLEVAGSVAVRLEVVSDLKLDNPLISDPARIATIASAASLDEAVRQSAADMLALLADRVTLAKPELVMLMSLVGQTEICQVVDPLKTARFAMPRWALDRYGVSL